jgi:hypothetical protein
MVGDEERPACHLDHPASGQSLSGLHRAAAKEKKG